MSSLFDLQNKKKTAPYSDRTYNRSLSILHDVLAFDKYLHLNFLYPFTNDFGFLIKNLTSQLLIDGLLQSKY
jgi:hypothetical protein